MFDTPAAQIGAFFVVLVCGFAFLKGDDTERVGGGAYILGWFASLLVQNDVGVYRDQIGLVTLDILMLIVLAGLAWKSRRAWPFWAAGFQLLSVMSHIIAQVDVRPPAMAFITVLNMSGYGVLIALAVGAFWAWQERRAAGLE